VAPRAVVRSLLTFAVSASFPCAAALVVAACDRDTDLSATLAHGGDAATEASSEAGPAAPMITVTSLAPALTTAPAAKASATWAAYRLDDGDWHALSPAAVGTYTFPIAVARWTIALVCASDDDTLSTVYVHHRTNATPDVKVTLDDGCTPPPPPAQFAFTGTLRNLPPATQWLDFGYARDSRGDAIPVTGTTGTYEIVGIEPGTWDVAFGVRDDPALALTRFVMRRGHVVTADEVVDVDVTGADSFAPGVRSMRLRGLIAGDTVTPSLFYAAGGPFGIDVGPQNVPDGQPDVTLAYSTVPDALQIASDRYHGELSAEQDRRTGSRTIAVDLHQAIDLDLTFLGEPPLPTVTVIATSPQVLFETRFPALANAERHEVVAQASSNRRSPHTIRSTYDVIYVGSSPEIVDTTPDLSVVPGWRAAWGLVPGATATIFATGYEKPQPLGDGTMQRAASKGLMLTP
jgi:hypothetical protein